jgi:hypothetical protein
LVFFTGEEAGLAGPESAGSLARAYIRKQIKNGKKRGKKKKKEKKKNAWLPQARTIPVLLHLSGKITVFATRKDGKKRSKWKTKRRKRFFFCFFLLKKGREKRKKKAEPS